MKHNFSVENLYKCVQTEVWRHRVRYPQHRPPLPASWSVISDKDSYQVLSVCTELNTKYVSKNDLCHPLLSICGTFCRLVDNFSSLLKLNRCWQWLRCLHQELSCDHDHYILHEEEGKRERTFRPLMKCLLISKGNRLYSFMSLYLLLVEVVLWGFLQGEQLPHKSAA